MRATQFVKTELAENYPKHQDLSGVATDKLKAYLDKQTKQSVPGEGSQVRRVQAELQRRKLTGDPAPQHYRDELAKAAAEYRKKQGVAEGSEDTVMFEIDSENAYNHVMKQFGSVVGWDGDTMVAPRKYWGSIQELAYSAGGEATEVGNEQAVGESGPRMIDPFGNEVQRTSGQAVSRSSEPRELRPGDTRSTATGTVTKTATGVRHTPYIDTTPKPRFVEQDVEESNKEKIGGRYDADDFDDMVARLKKLAGSGPMRTVYDPDRRVYRNMPTAVQPAQQPKKAPR
jgi:hypothetical protein